MTEPIYRLGAEGALSTAKSSTPSPLLSRDHSLTADFESAVFEEAEPMDATSPSQMTVENIVRIFCVSSLYREAFDSQEWGK